MAKTFSSISSLVSYIKNSCHTDALEEIGRDAIDVMKEVTEDQYEGETGQMVDCIDITNISNDSVEISWQDNGDWYSVISGDHMYAPIAHEMGTVWDKGHSPRNPVYKPATTLEETSKEKIEEDAPDTYRKVMRRKGFTVK